MKLVKSNVQFLALEGAKICTYLFSACADVLRLYVRHKLDICSRYVMHTLRHVSTTVWGYMRNSTSTLVYTEYVRDKF